MKGASLGGSPPLLSFARGCPVGGGRRGFHFWRLVHFEGGASDTSGAGRAHFRRSIAARQSALSAAAAPRSPRKDWREAALPMAGLCARPTGREPRSYDILEVVL